MMGRFILTMLLILVETACVRRLLRLWGGSTRGLWLSPVPAAFLIGASHFASYPASRYLVFGGILSVVLVHAWILWQTVDRDPELRTYRLAAITGLILCAFSAHHAHSRPFDDESVRLVAVVSLQSDGDLDLTDEYLREDWREFGVSENSFFADMAVKTRMAIERNYRTYYPYHAAGFPILLLPGYALGRPFGEAAARWGALLPVILSAVATVALLARFLFLQGMTVQGARRIALFLGLSAPWLFFGAHLWAEPIAGLGALWLVFALFHPGEKKCVEFFLMGAIVGALPLLHFRYLFLSLPLGLLVLAHALQRPRYFMLVALGLLATVPSLAINMLVRRDPGTLSLYNETIPIYAPYPGLADFPLSRLTDLSELSTRLLEPPSAFLPYLPWLLIIAPVGLRARAAAIWVALPTLMSILLYFPSGPLARFWVPILPLMVLAVAGRKSPNKFMCALGTCGIVKSFALLFVPMLCHDAVVAARFAQSLDERGWGLTGKVIFFLFG